VKRDNNNRCRKYIRQNSFRNLRYTDIGSTMSVATKGAIVIKKALIRKLTKKTHYTEIIPLPIAVIMVTIMLAAIVLIGGTGQAVDNPTADTSNIKEVGNPLAYYSLSLDTHSSEEWRPQLPDLPDGITLDPNWEQVLNDPARTEPAVPQPVRSVNIKSITTTTTEPVKPYRQAAEDSMCPMWHELATSIGWPQEELSKLSYVLWRESRCQPEQHNPDDPMGGSNGLMQINQFWCKPTQYWPDGWLQSHGVLTSCDDLYDPETNLKAGYSIWLNSGWSPWNM